MSTIYALSTIAGKSAVAVVRVSGPKARLVLGRLTLDQSKVINRRFSLRDLVHPQNKELLDRALTVFFRAPNTFTGEDTCEFHLHGSKAVVRSVLDAISHCHESVRYAEAGEFSKRAFFNGKLDLTQAEGLADLINAETDQQRRSASRQAGGALSKLYGGWRNELVDMRSLLEAVIDFGEDNDGIDDEVYDQALAKANTFREVLARHLRSSLKGELLRTGIQVVIFGPPNAGKSSLLNYLAQRDASIVSPEAGTTRDIVETILDVGGFPVIVGDTAGLRSGSSVGQIEQEGVRRAKARISEANIRLCVIPNGVLPDPISLEQIHRCNAVKSDSVILLLNKTDEKQSDIGYKKDVSNLTGICAENIFEVSCTHQLGLEHFLTGLLAKLRDLTSSEDHDGEIVGTNARHRDQIRKCLQHIDSFTGDTTRDIVLGAENLRYASDTLGRVTGRIDVEEILGKVFSSFCIGK